MSQRTTYLPRLSNPLARHWRGGFALVPTLLIIVIGLRVVFDWLPPIDNAVYVACVLIASAALLIWQLVGAARAIDQHFKSRGDLALAWFGYGAMIVCLALTCVHAYQLVSGPVIADDPVARVEAKRYLPLSEDGTRMLVNGDIEYGTNRALKETAAKYPAAKTLVLTSEGGLIYAAREMAVNIIALKLDTRVEGDCNSACTLVFTAGTNRSLGPDARLGFHQYRFQRVHPGQTITSDNEQQKDITYFHLRGISKTFTDRIFEAPPDTLWFPTREELLEAGVITK